MAIESRHPSRRASMARPGAAARISQTLRESDERASHRHRQRHGRGAFGRGTGQARARPLPVAVIGDEPRLAYNRVLLSALLAEEVGFCDIELKPARWWRDRGVTLRYGVRATAVDPIAREVTLSNGTRLSFSKLVFATGSQPIKLAIPGMDLPGVLTFRDIDDVHTI